MMADRAWVERNLGYDPVRDPPPLTTFALPAAAKATHLEDFQREIIDFDSDSPAGLQFLAFTKATGLSRYKDIPWPPGLSPQTQADAGGIVGGPLPHADVLVVTWTVDEGHALSRVLTPGKDSRNDYMAYTHRFTEISKDMRAGCPALEAQRLGAYWRTTIGTQSVIIFKSDSHMSQDGPKLPNLEVWRQIIREVAPKLIVTTGTAGGIGPQSEVGDVVVSPIVRFDCITKFKNSSFAKAHFESAPANATHFAAAEELMKVNSSQLPQDNTRSPKILVTDPGRLGSSVLTTDFFGFDTSDDHYKLQNLGSVSEMGDAVLGLATSGMEQAPPWLSVRNVSDPQIKADGLTLKQQAAIAAQIYKGFGRWSSVCSAVACWAVIASLDREGAVPEGQSAVRQSIRKPRSSESGRSRQSET